MRVFCYLALEANASALRAVRGERSEALIFHRIGHRDFARTTGDNTARVINDT